MTEKVTLHAETYNVTEADDSDGDSLTVTGLAMPFGKKSRNEVRYNKESVVATADTMINQPSLLNHDEHMVAGHVTKFTPGEHNGTEGMVYEIDVNPDVQLPSGPRLVDALERGDISNVSIQAFVNEDKSDGDEVVVESFAELSFVTIPGFPQTNVSVSSSVAGSERVGTPVTQFLEQHTTAEQDEEEEEGGEESDMSKEPFAGFDSFDDCVSQNQDKQDPEAYCAAIKRDVEAIEQSMEGGDIMNTATENFEEMTEPDLFGLIAGLYEGAGTEDIAERLEPFEFSPDARQAIEWIADLYGATPGEVADVLSELGEDGESVGGDKNNPSHKDDTTMSDEQEGNGQEDETPEESGQQQEQDQDVMEMLESIQERMDELSERVSALENQVEASDDEKDDEDDMDGEDAGEEQSKQGFVADEDTSEEQSLKDELKSAFKNRGDR